MAINKQKTSACCYTIPQSHHLGGRMCTSVFNTPAHRAAQKLENTHAIVKNIEAAESVGYREVS